MKTGNLGTSQDQTTHRLGIARPAFQAIAQMDRTKLILIRPLAAIVAHRDKADPVGASCDDGTNSGICGDELGRIEALGEAGGRYNALGARACPLDDCFAAEVDLADLERRIPEIELFRGSTMNLAYTNLSDAAITECESLLDRADHNDAGGPVRESNGGGREGAKHVDDRNRAGRPCRAVEQTVDRDFHSGL